MTTLLPQVLLLRMKNTHLLRVHHRLKNHTTTGKPLFPILHFFHLLRPSSKETKEVQAIMRPNYKQHKANPGVMKIL
jgi:hypothetical protein